MKIDQVILVATANPVYLPQWNRAARVWRTKFGIEPVLYFVGTPAEWEAAGKRGRLSEEHGVVRFLSRARSSDNPARCWQAPTTLYWAASHHPDTAGTDPVRMIAGLDVLPLGPQLLQALDDVPDTSFAVPFAGAYLPGTRHARSIGLKQLFKRGYLCCPSGFLTARASVWRSVMAVPVDYAKFIHERGRQDGHWGGDEEFLSRRLFELDGDLRVAYLHGFYTSVWAPAELCPGRPYVPAEVSSGRWAAVNDAKAGDPARDEWLVNIEKHISVWQ